jgi:ribosome-binding protein aMBF1 (putative translation factor)
MRDEIQESRVKCAVCGKSLVSYSSDCILHHIDYNEDKTIQVCRSCHRKIHSKKAKFPDLAPDKPKERSEEKEQENASKSILKGMTKQTFPDSFDPPSEKIKKAKQQRDKVKHTRY